MCFLQVENWSAFAPDFKELEENEEYEEKESEFDIEDEDRSVGSVEQDRKSGDESVDITTVQPIPAFCSSDEDPLNVSTDYRIVIGLQYIYICIVYVQVYYYSTCCFLLHLQLS